MSNIAAKKIAEALEDFPCDICGAEDSFTRYYADGYNMCGQCYKRHFKDAFYYVPKTSRKKDDGLRHD